MSHQSHTSRAIFELVSCLIVPGSDQPKEPRSFKIQVELFSSKSIILYFTSILFSFISLLLYSKIDGDFNDNLKRYLN